jgi:hypothetical protein
MTDPKLPEDEARKLLELLVECADGDLDHEDFSTDLDGLRTWFRDQNRNLDAEAALLWQRLFGSHPHNLSGKESPSSATVLNFPPSSRAEASRASKAVRMELAAAKTAQSATRDALLPFGDIWLDGHRCTLLASGADKRTFVRGPIREEAQKIFLGGESWPLSFRTEDGVFELVGLTKLHLDELADFHRTQATSARTE